MGSRVVAMKGARPAGAALLAALVVFGLTGSARAEADPWWGRDKALHFGFSAALGGGAYALACPWSEPYLPRVYVGAGVALGAGVGKELLDAAGYGDPSLRDLAWDVLGAALGTGLALSLDAGIHGWTASRRPSR